MTAWPTSKKAVSGPRGWADHGNCGGRAGDVSGALPDERSSPSCSRSVTTMKSHGCVLREDGARRPASRIRSRSEAGSVLSTSDSHRGETGFARLRRCSRRGRVRAGFRESCVLAATPHVYGVCGSSRVCSPKARSGSEPPAQSPLLVVTPGDLRRSQVQRNRNAEERPAVHCFLELPPPTAGPIGDGVAVRRLVERKQGSGSGMQSAFTAVLRRPSTVGFVEYALMRTAWPLLRRLSAPPPHRASHRSLLESALLSWSLGRTCWRAATRSTCRVTRSP